MKQNPSAIVEIVRGNSIESWHAVDIVIADTDGAIHSVYGNARMPVFPRSAVKALQALAFVESGTVDALDLSDRHIALACASHFGEAIHVATAREILAAAGLDTACLECGSQLPFHDADRVALIRDGSEVSAIHNNCSGKHAGFLAFAVHAGLPVQGYAAIGHTVQRVIADNLEAVTGARHREENHGIDGCSIPTYAIPLQKLASAYARFGTGQDAGPARSAAMLRIREACFRHPELVAGTGGFDTEFMKLFNQRVFVKTGAEGVCIAALPEMGLGIAVKCHDGAQRAAEVALATMVQVLLEVDVADKDALKKFINPPVLNRNGFRVGEIRLV
jgi:L-asparaginase II